MHFNIIVNPAGASGRAWKTWTQLEPVLAGHGYTLYKSTPEKGIGDICRELTSRGTETAIIVIGGDGSFNEALNGIADLENTLFGFVPCGTGNDLERDMDLPKDRRRLLERILEGQVRREADIGELTYKTQGGYSTRRFNISSDVGFGAATCAFADRSRLKPILNRLGLGQLIYLIQAVKVCATVAPADITVTIAGRSHTYRRCLSAIAMNHCYEGGGFKFCPHASHTDGKLDLCIGGGLTIPQFVHVLLRAYKGTHGSMKGIHLKRARQVEMKSTQPLWVHTDGEVLGTTTYVRMRIIDQKLKMLL